jgi:hypothetical protein
LIILVAFVLGALIAYLWAIAPFYMVSNQVNVTDAAFPVDDANYFNVTVVNPSNSPGTTNITYVSLTGEGQVEPINVSSVSPSLPVSLDRGVSATLECQASWGDFAGKNLTVHVLSLNSPEATFQVTPQFVQLTVSASFNATESVQYFDVTVTNNANSAIDLNLSSVSLDYQPVSSLSVTPPTSVAKGQSVSFRCFSSWEGHPQPLVSVETLQGYTASVRETVGSSALLLIENLKFNEENSTRASMVLTNSAESATLVDVANITVSHGNVTDVISGNMSSPSLPYPLDVNSSVTLDCVWNWTDSSLRSTNVTVTAYTSQGFVSSPLSIVTPAKVDGRIDHAVFDLEDTGHFTLNVTNLAYSLQSINVTGVDFNQTSTTITPTLLAPGIQAALVCGFNWSTFLGQHVTVSANVTYGGNVSMVLRLYNVTAPYYNITNVEFDRFSLGNPYVNVTVRNSEFSKRNATVTQITVNTENVTFLIDGTISYPKISGGYAVPTGTETTFVCPWDWSPYVGQDVTITVQTADGFTASMTLRV